MARKPAPKKSPAKPQPDAAQLKAVERLLEQRDYAGAIRRIHPLLQRYPDHGGLHRALIEALEHTEGAAGAALAAYGWAERRPNSQPAQEALLHYANALGHLMLADRTAARVRELGGQTRGYPIAPERKTAMLALPDGTCTTAEVMERFDVGKLHLEAKDFSGALRWLADLQIPPARNNRALALFHLQRIDEALEAFLANWQAHPNNLFALAYAARLRLYRGDETGALGLCTPLAAAAALRPDDALAQVLALLLLGQDAGAWGAFERATGSDWFAAGAGRGDARLRHFGACAAARLGDTTAAARWWREATRMDPELRLAHTNLKLLDQGSEAARLPATWDLHEALPITWTQGLRAGGEAEVEARLDALAASTAYLRAVYLGGEESLRKLVGIILKRRARQTDAEAAHSLRTLARLPAGTQGERFGFLTFLRSEGLIARGEVVEYLGDEGVREVKMVSTEITREAEESDLPPDLGDLLVEGIQGFNEHRLDAAERCFQAILARIPGHPVALGNLAALRLAQGRREEGRELLRQVVAEHPDYLFARCNLAQILIREGAIAEAEGLLQGLGERERLHIQEAFTLYGALALLAQAKGEDERARSFVANLEPLVDDEDDERRLTQIKLNLGWLDPATRLRELLKAAVKGGPRPGRKSGR